MPNFKGELRMDFSDQVAIITGSSAGIGEAAAIGMAEGGAKLVINYSKSADAAEKSRSRL